MKCVMGKFDLFFYVMICVTKLEACIYKNVEE